MGGSLALLGQLEPLGGEFASLTGQLVTLTRKLVALAAHFIALAGNFVTPVACFFPNRTRALVHGRVHPVIGGRLFIV